MTKSSAVNTFTYLKLKNLPLMQIITKSVRLVPNPIPYVTDGLIAMWDGQWNAGYGVHDPATTTWKDLIGGVGDFTLKPGGTFADNHLICNGLAAELPWKNATVPITIETVVKADCDHDISRIVLFLGEGYKYSCRTFIISSNALIQFYSYSGKYTSVLPETPTSYSCRYGSDAISSPTEENKSIAVFVNGTDMTPANYLPKTWDCFYPFSAHKLQIGNGHKGSSPFEGSIHCLRFYNRNLTPEEIFSNFTVDKTRFKIN